MYTRQLEPMTKREPELGWPKGDRSFKWESRLAKNPFHFFKEK